VKSTPETWIESCPEAVYSPLSRYSSVETGFTSPEIEAVT
jgi:hypothetical protein